MAHVTRVLLLLISVGMTAGCVFAAHEMTGGGKSVKIESTKGKGWYKGMLHCHSYWSDGRAFPEQAVSAYRELGYDFMSLTDHNRLVMKGDEWRPICKAEGNWPPKVITLYADNVKRRFPWTQTRINAKGVEEIRITPYSELLSHFNDPGRFLLIPGTEITRGTSNDWSKGRQVHVNYSGLEEVIPSARYARIIQNIFADHTASTLIRSTREETEMLARASGNPPHIVIVDHPHWPYYDLVPQDLIDNSEVRFFEICNNGADQPAPPELQYLEGYDVDRFWDVVNAFRARAGKALLYGTASDDAHWYAYSGATVPEMCRGAYSGDGWIQVRANVLTPSAIFAAMDRGDFYASSGLDLEDVCFDGRTLRVKAPPVVGATNTVIKFIVTKRDFDDRIVKTIPIRNKKYIRDIPIYSDTIGAVASEHRGDAAKPLAASYTLKDDDLYVRARVESDLPSPYAAWHGGSQTNCYVHPFRATAWTQPYRIGDVQ